MTQRHRGPAHVSEVQPQKGSTLNHFHASSLMPGDPRSHPACVRGKLGFIVHICNGASSAWRRRYRIWHVQRRRRTKIATMSGEDGSVEIWVSPSRSHSFWLTRSVCHPWMTETHSPGINAQSHRDQLQIHKAREYTAFKHYFWKLEPTAVPCPWLLRVNKNSLLSSS